MKRIPLATSILLLLCFYANAQSELDRGIVREGVYTNSRFGFSFQYPKGWTVHGDATVERMKELGKEKVVAEVVLSKETA